MSTVIMAKVWPMKLPPSQKMVLVSLADNANDHGDCWPSIPTICERTCLGRTAVIEAIKALRERGFLQVDQDRRFNRYTITLPGPDLFESVRETDQSGKRISPPRGPHQSASRTSPVRQADPNRQEPSRTIEATPQHAEGVSTDKRGTRLPEDWQPSDDVKAWARDKAPGVDLVLAVDEFRDYWRSVPGARGRRLDWDATFRNRLRELTSRRSGHAGSGGHRESAADRVRRNVEARGAIDGECTRLG